MGGEAPYEDGFPVPTGWINYARHYGFHAKFGMSVQKLMLIYLHTTSNQTKQEDIGQEALKSIKEDYSLIQEAVSKDLDDLTPPEEEQEIAEDKPKEEL